MNGLVMMFKCDHMCMIFKFGGYTAVRKSMR